MRKYLYTLLVAMSSCLLANAQTALPQDSAKHVSRRFPMAVEHLYFHSNILNFDKNFTVNLPKSYASEPNRKYPVVYMLHGANENDWEWANLPSQTINEAIAQVTNDGSAAEMIVVFPNATEGKMGYFNQEGWNYEDYFFKELVPYIESHYRVIADKGHRAIGGLSMGGGGSFNYGMRHPEMFSSVYAISAAVTPAIFPTSEAPAPNLPAAMNPGTYTQNQIDAAKSVYFVLDCGDDDFLFDTNVATFQQMKKNGMQVQFRVRDGGHTSYYWYDGIREALKYFTRHFSEQMK